MKLPNAAAAAEIPTHRIGKSKAAFFSACGFSRERWTELADALRQHVLDHEVSEREETPFGTRYIIDGPMPRPAGQSSDQALNLRSVWFIDKDGDAPRFVTAHPLKKIRS